MPPFPTDLLRPSFLSTTTRVFRCVIPSSSSSQLLVPRHLNVQLPPSQNDHNRHFVTNPLTPTTQTLHATRTLSYAAPALYALIADIAAYPAFLPYCTSASITSWSAPHPTKSVRYPQAATLGVGFQSYTESFHSRVYCAPDHIVEAVCGDAKTSIPEAELEHYKDAAMKQDSEVPTSDIFASLLTRWTLRPFHYKPPPTQKDGEPPKGVAESNPGEGEISPPSEPRTEVDLHIEVRFASPLYAALSQAAAPKVAGLLVEAFEKRAREVLG